MTKTRFAEFSCSIARTLDVVGERWAILIMRSIFLGVTRFEDLQRELGIARNVLAERLDALVGHGVLERRAYQERPLRHEYVLTEKGRDLLSPLLAIMAWGDRWESGDAGPPVELRHDACGNATRPEVVCSCCGEPLTMETVTAHAGPGGRIGRGTAVTGALLAAGPRRLGAERPDHASGGSG
jgi:DNA-binding HxlR family transcriptional regulator